MHCGHIIVAASRYVLCCTCAYIGQRFVGCRLIPGGLYDSEFQRFSGLNHARERNGATLEAKAELPLLPMLCEALCLCSCLINDPGGKTATLIHWPDPSATIHSLWWIAPLFHLFFLESFIWTFLMFLKLCGTHCFNRCVLNYVRVLLNVTCFIISLKMQNIKCS